MKDLDIIMGWNIGEGQTQAEELAQMEEQAEAEAEYNRTLEAEYNKACEEQQAFEEALEDRIAELEAAVAQRDRHIEGLGEDIGIAYSNSQLWRLKPEATE